MKVMSVERVHGIDIEWIVGLTEAAMDFVRLIATRSPGLIPASGFAVMWDARERDCHCIGHLEDDGPHRRLLYISEAVWYSVPASVRADRLADDLIVGAARDSFIRRDGNGELLLLLGQRLFIGGLAEKMLEMVTECAMGCDAAQRRLGIIDADSTIN